jgi:hypothetical protein
MNKLLSFMSLVAVATLSGCAVGPLANHETGRTVGISNHELMGGYNQGGYVLKWNYGLTENLDLGLHWESLSTGIRSKYAFVNNQEGWSLASALGAGISLTGSHYYGDLVGSYLIGSWEPYGTLRLVHVRNDSWDSNVDDDDSGLLNFTIPSIQYNYGQIFLGTRYWITPHWLFSLEASSFFSMSSGLEFDNSVLVGGSFGYRF